MRKLNEIERYSRLSQIRTYNRLKNCCNVGGFCDGRNMTLGTGGVGKSIPFWLPNKLLIT
jgi:hypothetical protein